MAFTKRQRDWIVDRDGNKCMFHEKKGNKWIRCNSQKSLHVHHIVPQLWSEVNLSDWCGDIPSNGVTLCKFHHAGSMNSVHPSGYVASLEYARDKQAYQKMQETAESSSVKGVPYWKTDWDWMFTRIARRKTHSYVLLVPWPENGAKKPNDFE